MTGARVTAYMVVALACAPNCRGEIVPQPTMTPSASASGTGSTSSTADASTSGSVLSVVGPGEGTENAVASMRGCKVDKDCVLVRVSCGAEAAVAAVSKAAAESAMLAACPSGGVGGWNPSAPLPKVNCGAGKCELSY